MPVITQEGGIARVDGLPVRWGVRALAMLKKAKGLDLLAVPPAYIALCKVIDRITSGPVAIDSTDAQLCIIAQSRAVRCMDAVLMLRVTPWANEKTALLFYYKTVSKRLGIAAHESRDDAQVIARFQDAAWWRRQLRKAHARAFESAAVALGFVSRAQGAYCSDETVARRAGQSRRNAAALESVMMINGKNNIFSLSELAAKGTSNKKIRRGELMLRMSGCESVAIEADHVGVFTTQTCPSKYHAILSKTGAPNPKHEGATPRDAQAYLMDTWALSRAELARLGIRPYGFRIAEPHHDGCVHWHSLVFMPVDQVEQFRATLAHYALAESGEETQGNDSVRIKFVNIDPAKGGAAAYIAKYILKNLDDSASSATDEVDGKEYFIKQRGQVTPAQRVDAWAGVWGIRQFQPIGMPPVTIWREIRRIPAGEVQGAAPEVRKAWDAAQRVSKTDEDGVIEVLHAADFGDYIRAQGGVCMGRDYAIAMAQKSEAVDGRYGMFHAMANIGIFAKSDPDRVYASVRYTWARLNLGGDVLAAFPGCRKALDLGAAFDLPWSPVNNCTGAVWYDNAPEITEKSVFDDREYYGSNFSDENKEEKPDMWILGYRIRKENSGDGVTGSGWCLDDERDRETHYREHKRVKNLENLRRKNA